MIAQGNINTGPPAADTAAYQEPDEDRQRGGGGFMSFMLFPLISIAAIAFAAIELVR